MTNLLACVAAAGIISVAMSPALRADEPARDDGLRIQAQDAPVASVIDAPGAPTDVAPPAEASSEERGDVLVTRFAEQDILIILNERECRAEMRVDVLSAKEMFYLRGRTRLESLTKGVQAIVSSRCPGLGRLWIQGRADDSEYTVFLAVMEPGERWTPQFLVLPRKPSGGERASRR